MNFRESLRMRSAQADARASLKDLQAKVIPRMVTAIPPYSAIEWVDGYRFAFFPRSVPGHAEGALTAPLTARRASGLPALT